MAKKRPKTGVTNEKIMSFLVEMDERITTMDGRVAGMDGRITSVDGRLAHMNETMATKADLLNYVTKNDLERTKEEILDVIRPIAKAVDKDAEMLMGVK